MVLRTFLSNKVDNKKFRFDGLAPSRRLPKKRELCQKFHHHKMYGHGQLPPKVDLRSDMTPVEYQSKIGSCAANTMAGAYEYLTKKATGRHIDVSRLFIYYYARVQEKKSLKVSDEGCSMTSAIEALGKYGVCLESVWPYYINRVNRRPSKRAYDEAKHHKIIEAFRVNVNLSEMKSCLAQGFPFAFGLKLYKSFDQAASNGVVPMPNTWEKSRNTHGSHALLAVGYSDKSKAFIVRNSWGEQWGDKGYCYIPYSYVANPDFCFDVWTIRRVGSNSNNLGQAHWDALDAINYTRVGQHHDPSADFDDHTRVIETVEEKDEENDVHDGDNDDNYDVDFDDSDDDNNGHMQKGNFDLPHDQRGAHGGNNHPRNNGHDQRPELFGGHAGGGNFLHPHRPPHSPHPQHLPRPPHSPRPSHSHRPPIGFELLNNSPNFSDIPFNQSPVIPRHRLPGQNFGNASPFNNRAHPDFQ